MGKTVGLDERGLCSIANFCPNLERMSLYMCGMIDDEVVEHYSKRLKKLRHLNFYGPFLVTTEKWKDFFGSIGDKERLTGFMIRQSPSES
jgi:DNA repair protein RAD7